MAKLKHNNVKIEGLCPNCGRNGSVVFTDFYYTGEKYPYAEDIPFCNGCCWDEIRVRKINNRRYKIHEVQWDEYYDSLSKYSSDYVGEEG